MPPPDADTPPPAATAAAPAPALGETFVRGMAWGTAGLVVGKFSTFLATVALGWIFGAADYGAAGAAVSAAMIGDVLTDGGLRRVLITRGVEYAALARTVFGVALAFNLLGCGLMLAATPFYRDAHPDAVAPLAAFAVALVLSTLSTVQRCKLSIDLRFAQIAGMGAASSVLRNVLMVLFAWAGLGPLAFALPLVFVNLWEAAYLRRAVGPVPAAPFDAGVARALVRQGRWVILATIGGSLVYRGDFLVTTWLLSPAAAGDYFFAFQLTIALFAPLSVGVSALVQPVMARLRDDPARQAQAFVRLVRTAALLAAPASLAAVLVTPLLIHLVWRGKWDAVATAVQVLAATECVRQAHHMALATIDARGEWRRSAAVVLVDGAGVVVAALIGASTGSMLAVAVCVAIERTLAAVAQAMLTHRLTGGRGRAMASELLVPPLIAVAVGAAAVAAAHGVAADADARRWLLAAAVVPAVIAYAAATRALVPIRFAEARALILSRVGRPRA